MKLIVGINKITIDETDTLNAGEYNIHNIEYEFDDVYNGLVKKATFGDGNKNYLVDIDDNECVIPYEILEESGIKEFGVYAYEVDGEDLLLRYSPTPIRKSIIKGSYKENFDNYEVPTADTVEQIEQQIQNLENQVDGLDGIVERVTNLEIQVGDIDGILDEINGEVI